MKDKILQMINDYWKFDNQQQPISSWHDKQDLLKAIEEMLPQPNALNIELGTPPFTPFQCTCNECNK